MIPTIWYSGKGKIIDKIKRIREKGGMCGPEHQGFGGSKTILYDTRMVDVCCYTFVQTHRMSTTKNEPCCKWWALSDNDVSSCRFEDWNSSWEITWGGCACLCEDRDYMGNLYTLHSICWDPKIALKIKSIKNASGGPVVGNHLSMPETQVRSLV